MSTEQILSSRRSFLKMLGAAATAAAMPVSLIEQALAGQPLSADPGKLVAGLLHVEIDGVWRALGELASLHSIRRSERIEDKAGGVRKGARISNINVGVYSDARVLEFASEAMYGDRTRYRFAASTDTHAYVFEADMMSSTINLDTSKPMVSEFGLREAGPITRVTL